MRFHVGPYSYTLVVSDSQLFDADGVELDGLAVEAHRLLILSRSVDPDRRAEIAYHEYQHAWHFHVPAPSNEEERHNLGSMMRAQFERDLESAGGEDALRAMPLTRVRGDVGRRAPVKTLALPPRETFGPADRMPCGTCEMPILCGDISHGEPVLHEHTKQFRVERWFRCDGCGSLQIWWELCLPDGGPLGEFVSIPKPRLLHGREAAEWLRSKRECATVAG